jgi:F-type H+-transporting ATPase subunit delta
VATNSSVIGGIASRYAAALYELADEGKALDSVAGDLSALKSLIVESADLANLIRSPLIDRNDKAEAMNSVLKQAGSDDLTRRFIGIVARNNRLFALPAMIDAFLAELAERRGEITAQVASARTLSEEQLAKIAETLQTALGGRITLEQRVDPSLIGGLVVRVGSRMIDASLKSKLQRLQVAMKGAQ